MRIARGLLLCVCVALAWPSPGAMASSGDGSSPALTHEVGGSSPVASPPNAAAAQSSSRPVEKPKRRYTVTEKVRAARRKPMTAEQEDARINNLVKARNARLQKLQQQKEQRPSAPTKNKMTPEGRASLQQSVEKARLAHQLKAAAKRTPEQVEAAQEKQARKAAREGKTTDVPKQKRSSEPPEQHAAGTVPSSGSPVPIVGSSPQRHAGVAAGSVSEGAAKPKRRYTVSEKVLAARRRPLRPEKEEARNSILDKARQSRQLQMQQLKEQGLPITKPRSGKNNMTPEGSARLSENAKKARLGKALSVASRRTPEQVDEYHERQAGKARRKERIERSKQQKSNNSSGQSSAALDRTSSPPNSIFESSPHRRAELPAVAPGCAENTLTGAHAVNTLAQHLLQHRMEPSSAGEPVNGDGRKKRKITITPASTEARKSNLVKAHAARRLKFEQRLAAGPDSDEPKRKLTMTPLAIEARRKNLVSAQAARRAQYEQRVQLKQAGAAATLPTTEARQRASKANVKKAQMMRQLKTMVARTPQQEEKYQLKKARQEARKASQGGSKDGAATMSSVAPLSLQRHHLATLTHKPDPET